MPVYSERMEPTSLSPPGKASTAASSPGRARPMPRGFTLPSGRTILGAALVTTAAVRASATGSREPAHARPPYLVVDESIRAGDTLHDASVRVELLDLTPAVAATAVRPGEVAGVTALVDLRPGELLGADDVAAPTSIEAPSTTDFHEVTLAVPTDWSPSELRPGEWVTVLTSSGAGETLRTTVAAEDLRVLAFEGPDGTLGRADARLTVAVPDATTVLELTARARSGDVTVVRSTRALADRFPTEERSDG